MSQPYRSAPLYWAGLPRHFRDELVAELEPGEGVLWAGMPRPLRLVQRGLRGLPFPLAWNGCALALLAMTASVSGLLWLCAVPLLAIGLPLFLVPLGFFR